MGEERLGLLIKRISHLAKKDTDNAMKKWDLTMSQAMVLEYLNNAPSQELTQRDIEQHFNLQHPTVSGIIKRLEKNGFIRTAINTNDRRVKDIFQTDKARQLDVKAKMHQERMEETFVKGLSPEEIDTLRGLLTRLLNNISGD